MAKFERVREALQGPLSEEQIRRAQEKGWKLVAVEWERPLAEGQTGTSEPVPFGLSIAEDGVHLVENSTEREVLRMMMELMIQDKRFTEIAEELNQRGFLTREGAKWGPVAVFDLLPRLIEVGPRIFSEREWHERRTRAYAQRVQ